MIRLEDIVVEFKGRDRNIRAVNNVNLNIERGDVYGIVGFSGAGKSTLVRTINLLQRPTSGNVYVDGVELNSISEKELRREREKIGMIFQHFNLMSSRTVLGNVLYPLKNSGLSKEEKEKKVEKLLRLVDIYDKKDAYPSQLSGGQKQRVAIARALANDPKILLCDEATSALDPQTTTQILKLLKNLNEELGLTIVIITHEMQVVKEICNKVAVMEHGNVVEEGEIFDIFATPKQDITKGFIQSVNHIDEQFEQLAKLDATKNLGKNKRLIKLVYIGEVSQEPVIAELVQKYGVVSNIIWGNIEVISNKPIGNLAIVMEGEEKNIDSAIKTLVKRGALVEEIIIKDGNISRSSLIGEEDKERKVI